MFKRLEQRRKKRMKITADLPVQIEEKHLSSDLLKNKKVLEDLFGNSVDFTVHPLYVDHEPKIIFFYLDSLTDEKSLNNILLRPILYEGVPNGLQRVRELKEIIDQQLIGSTPLETITLWEDVVLEILKGSIIILVDGEAKALMTKLDGIDKRGIDEPETEVSIRGPRDGFNESIDTNIAHVRKRIRSTRLKLEEVVVGRLTQTEIVIAYIDGLVEEDILQKVRERIEKIDIDAVLESGYIEEMIEEHPFTPFPQMQNTERPDTAAANLLEGKVVVFVDNTPFVLIIPMTFWEGLTAAEDSYERFIYVSFVRLIRFFMFNAAILLPSVYVALITFHPKLIPTSLLISIAAARENVPFPVLIEALLMELVFEALREAGIRLPSAIGSAISIVGAIVVGEAAVQAGIVSSPMVIVVATTGIASLAIPRYNIGTALRIIRFPILILSGVFGLYGIVMGFIILHIHLVNLTSFGIPYFTPVAPQIPADLRKVLLRSPKWANIYGPYYTYGRDHKRISTNNPSSSQKGEGK